jgi:predicted ATPase
VHVCAIKVVLVAGYSGVGKTSLINQLRDIKEHAYLISGKYDFSKREVPYSGVVSAFTDMVHQVRVSCLHAFDCFVNNALRQHYLSLSLSARQHRFWRRARKLSRS